MTGDKYKGTIYPYPIECHRCSGRYIIYDHVENKLGTYRLFTCECCGDTTWGHVPHKLCELTLPAVPKPSGCPCCSRQGGQS
jgi:hypothetical protein